MNGSTPSSRKASRPLRILVVANTFPPEEQGGGGRVAGDCALGMRALGHEVTVLTTRLPSKSWRMFPQPETWNGCAVYRWYPPNVYPLRKAWGKPAWLKALWTLWDAVNPLSRWIVGRWIRTWKPDLIVSHNLKGMGYGLPSLFAQKAAYVHVLHDVQLIEPSGILYAGRFGSHPDHKHGPGLASRIHTRLMRRAFRTVRKVAAPSDFLLNFHAERGFFPDAVLKKIRNPVEIPEGEGVPERLLFAVGASRYKGLPEVLELWDRLHWTDWTLAVAGGGDALGMLQQRAESDPRIRVLGNLHRNAYFEQLKRAGILVHLSRCLEGWSMAMAEARSLGIPILASKAGGSVDFEADGHIEWVDPGDLEASVRVAERFRQEFDQIRPSAHFPDARAYAQLLLDWGWEPPPE